MNPAVKYSSFSPSTCNPKSIGRKFCKVKDFSKVIFIEKEVTVMKRILIVATGGTIASEANEFGETVARVPAQTLLDSLTLPTGVHVEMRQVLQLNSFNITFSEMVVLAQHLTRFLAEPEVDAVVVTHGTDTLEENAFLQSLFLDSSKPVVFTGAQYAADLPDSDGPRNLSEAIAVASDELSRGIGVVIVFAGKIWSSAGTRKMRTLDIAAFDSEFGPMGSVKREVVTFERRPDRLPLFKLEEFHSADLRVDIVTCYGGTDTVALDAFVATGSKGLVIEAMGAGNAGRGLNKNLLTLLEGNMPMILTSRVPQGMVAGIYSDGGGADLIAAGAILGGLYRAPQLRILMLVALGCARGSSPDIHTAREILVNFLAPTSKKMGVLE